MRQCFQKKNTLAGIKDGVVSYAEIGLLTNDLSEFIASIYSQGWRIGDRVTDRKISISLLLTLFLLLS